MNRPRWKALRWLLAALVPLSAATFYFFGLPARRPDTITPLVDSLTVLRALADSCRTDLDRGTAGFEAYDRRLDSMRARVRDLEAIDPRGVPTDSYAVYMRLFDEYNDSIPGWTRRADSLRTRWTRCRDLAQTHNLLADSVSRLLLQQQEEAQRNRSGR